MITIKADTDCEPTRSARLQEQLQKIMAVAGEYKEIGVQIERDRISLCCPELDKRARVAICFHQGATQHRRLYGGGKSQILSKAVGTDQKPGLRVLDATAGLAGDSFVLASLKARVQMLERSPLLFLMIQDALSVTKDVSSDQSLLETIERMSILQADALSWLNKQSRGMFDVIYLDPMFPERKKKAAVKKEMQVLQYLLGESDKPDAARLDEEQRLLQLSIEKASHRVVVKRPRHAPPLPGEEPGYCLEGKSTRFDIYPLTKIS